MTIEMSRDDILDYIQRHLQKHNERNIYDLKRFLAEGEADELTDPELRDLYLIWGSLLMEDDDG